MRGDVFELARSVYLVVGDVKLHRRHYHAYAVARGVEHVVVDAHALPIVAGVHLATRYLHTLRSTDVYAVPSTFYI